jgi:hypothetical protein
MDEPAPDAEHHRRRDDARQLDDRHVPGTDPVRPLVGREQRAVLDREPLALDVFPGEGLDDAHPGEALLQRRQHRADPVPDRQVRLARVALELHAGHDHERHRDQADEDELPRQPDQQDHGEDEEQPVGQEHQQALLHQLGQRVDVRGHPGDDHAGLLAVVEGHRERLEVVEHPDAQVPQERLAEPGDEQDLPAREQERGEGDDDVGADGEVQGAGVTGPQAVVDAVADEGRPGDDGGGPPDHHERGQEQAQALRAQQLPRAADHVGGGVPVERRRRAHATSSASVAWAAAVRISR